MIFFYKTSDTANNKSGHFSSVDTKNSINRNMRRIWKVLSMVFISVTNLQTLSFLVSF